MLIALRRTLTLTQTPKPNHYHLYSTLSPLTPTSLKTLIQSHYKNNKYTNLLTTVVSSPSLLYTAALNLTTTTTSPSRDPALFIDFHQLSHDLSHTEFNPALHCAQLTPVGHGRSGVYSNKTLLLPKLSLRVIIEALRIVLEAVYDPGFTTFCYGSRPRLGRHTAVRYLKNYVENPTWWFTVCFCRQEFEADHVGRLCRVLKERIDDEGLISLINGLFECGVVRIDLGGGYLGRGLPQESGLCGILINVYLNRFDKKVQRLRIRLNEAKAKAKAKPEEGGYEGGSDVIVVHKPVRVYAVRYLDEVLMATSGSKVLTMDMMNWVVKELEGEFELKVDKLRTVIHSAVSEKIGFLGMELQAVTPSALRPPISEKAMRARKKFRRQQEVKRMEMKNARERNRRMMGMKVFSHVFKKVKQSGCEFKFEYRIENEVREIFRTWADEVVQEFFESVEERWNWHRQLTSGDFLSLKRIRDQLPQELVDSYDKFQKEVDRHLSPVKLRKALEEDERKAEEEEERKYSERTVQDLTKLCMKVTAPIELVRKAVRLAGFTNNLGRPRPISWLSALEDVDIIKWYAGVGRRWLEFYCCCRNFEMVKTVVTYHLRFSCLLTLAEKHESTKRETIKHFTKDLRVLSMDGNEEVYFPTEREVKSMGDGHFSDPKPVDSAITLALIRLAYDEPSYSCAAYFCGRKDTVTYRVRLLQRQLGVNPGDKEKWVPGLAAIHESLDRKCYPLCPDHISDLYMGKLSLQNIDCTAFVDVD